MDQENELENFGGCVGGNVIGSLAGSAARTGLNKDCCYKLRS